MIGHEVSNHEYEMFCILYAVAVIQKLMEDKLLMTASPWILQDKGHATMKEMSQVYPLPDYTTLAESAYKVMEGDKLNLHFSVQDLEKLLINVEALNGYVL